MSEFNIRILKSYLSVKIPLRFRLIVLTCIMSKYDVKYSNLYFKLYQNLSFESYYVHSVIFKVASQVKNSYPTLNSDLNILFETRLKSRLFI